LKKTTDIPETKNILPFINDTKGFLEKLEYLQITQEDTHLKRLNKWFEFFNNNHSKGVCMYSQTIFALLDVASYNDIFRNQTTHEFELSLKFYKQIFDLDIFVSFDELDPAILLLKISLIFSKYPGMVSCSIKESISQLENGSDIATLNAIFTSLFVKYENPYILTNNLELLTHSDIKLLMYILQGNNIRNYKNIPFSLSRKESFIFINQLPKNLTFKDNLLGRTIVFSKLYNTKSCNNELLNPFLSYSKVFRYNLSDFNKDIMFWKSVFRFISKDNCAINNISIQEYIDYFEYMKYADNPNYSLRGRTLLSVENAIDEWHESANYSKTQELIRLEWYRTTEKDIKITKETVNYIFKEITTGEELFIESETLSHCVFSYIENCVLGYIAIWSLQKETDSIYNPLLTIEVIDNTIVQVFGKHNREPNKVENILIEEWAEIMDYQIDFSN